MVLLQAVLWAAFVALPYFMVPRQSEEAATDAYMKLTASQYLQATIGPIIKKIYAKSLL